MNIWRTGAAILVVTWMAQGVIAQNAVENDGVYLDPQIKNRDQCLDHPGRPAWIMVQPEGMEWRRDLMVAYGQLQIRERVVETNDCSCDNRYPNWETFRPAMDDLLELYDEVRLTDMSEEQQDHLYRHERSLRRTASKIGFEFGKACRDTS